MAVYTPVSEDQAARFIQAYGLGQFQKLTPIEAGIENTNYFIDTIKRRFVLTLFEARVREQDLPFFIAFMDHLHKADLPVAQVMRREDGGAIGRLADRPAIVTSFLEGTSPDLPATPDICHTMGNMVARMHSAAESFPQHRHNALALEGWQRLAATILPGAGAIDPALPHHIQSELDHLTHHWPAPSTLPRTIIHADLFPDNIFFIGKTLTGVIDFYFACEDFAAYDLAITLTAWGFDKDDQLDRQACRALLAGYQAQRPLSPSERQALPLLMRGAAMRFLLTRTYDWLHQQQDALVVVKDPLAYHRRLMAIKQLSPADWHGLMETEGYD